MHAAIATTTAVLATLPHALSRPPISVEPQPSGHPGAIRNIRSTLLEGSVPVRALPSASRLTASLLADVAPLRRADTLPYTTGGGYRTEADAVMNARFDPNMQQCIRETGASSVPAERIIGNCAATTALALCDQDQDCLTTLQRSIGGPYAETEPAAPFSTLRKEIVKEVTERAQASDAWQEAFSSIQWELDVALWGELPAPGYRYTSEWLQNVIDTMGDSDQQVVHAELLAISAQCGAQLRAELTRIHAREPERIDTAGYRLLLSHLDAHFAQEGVESTLTPKQFTQILKYVTNYLNTAD